MPQLTNKMNNDIKNKINYLLVNQKLRNSEENKDAEFININQV